jgi:hypothetical protein
LLVGVVSANQGAFTVSDDKSNAWALVDSVVDSNSAYVAIYVATNVMAGTRFIKLHRTVSAGEVAMSASEYYNVSSVDAHSCNAGSGSMAIAAGSITPTVSGDLLWQWAINAGGGGSLPNSTTSFAEGSQANIGWQLNGTDLYDGDAVQAGIYSSTSAINPTFSSGTAEAFTSCVMALKAAGTGNAPTDALRIVHMLHQQMPASAANPYPFQFASSGDLVVVSYNGGGDAITGISSTPSNTWSSAGTAVTSGTNISQIYYAASATSSNTLKLSVTRDGTTHDATFMMYDFVGAAAAPFDIDSGGQSNNQGSVVGALTTCGGCLTPTGVINGSEVIIANFAQDFCTASGINVPSGGLFDSATDTGNSNSGPQSVDQNNGWMHYYDSGTSAITVTWAESCEATPQGNWAGRVAAFKGTP